MHTLFCLIVACSPNGWHDVTDYGAEGDGYTDDYDAVQDASDAAENGTLYFPPGTYLIDGLVRIWNGEHVRCAGGAVLKMGTTIEGGLFYLGGVDEVIIDGCSFDGDSIAGMGAIYMQGSPDTVSRIVIQNNSFYGWGNGAINTGPGIDPIESLVVKNNFFEDIDDNAVELPFDSVSSVVIDGNFFVDIGFGGGAIEVDEGAYDVSISNNFVKSTYEQGIQVEQGGHSTRIIGNVVNTTTVPGQACIQVKGRSIQDPSYDTVVVGNQVENCDGDGILIDMATNVSVSDNVIRNTTKNGIRVNESLGISLNGNLAHNNGDGFNECGIKIYASSDVSMSDNHTYLNYHHGICIRYSEHVTLTGNHTNDNGQLELGDSSGIMLQGSYYCSASSNTARDTRSGEARTQVFGMREDWGSDYNTWSANVGRNNRTPIASYEVYVNGANSSEIGSIEVD